VCDVSVVSVCA